MIRSLWRRRIVPCTVKVQSTYRTSITAHKDQSNIDIACRLAKRIEKTLVSIWTQLINKAKQHTRQKQQNEEANITRRVQYKEWYQGTNICTKTILRYILYSPCMMQHACRVWLKRTIASGSLRVRSCGRQHFVPNAASTTVALKECESFGVVIAEYW